MPVAVMQSYEEFKFVEHFGLSLTYDEMPMHKVDWWQKFMKVDRDVEQELRDRAKPKT